MAWSCSEIRLGMSESVPSNRFRVKDPTPRKKLLSKQSLQNNANIHNRTLAPLRRTFWRVLALSYLLQNYCLNFIGWPSKLGIYNKVLNHICVSGGSLHSLDKASFDGSVSCKHQVTLWFHVIIFVPSAISMIDGQRCFKQSPPQKSRVIFQALLSTNLWPV